jgi:hypothetical protein
MTSVSPKCLKAWWRVHMAACVNLKSRFGALGSTRKYVRTYVRTYVRKYVCMYVYLYVHMYVCMYVCMYARTLWHGAPQHEVIYWPGVEKRRTLTWHPSRASSAHCELWARYRELPGGSMVAYVFFPKQTYLWARAPLTVAGQHFRL